MAVVAQANGVDYIHIFIVILVIWHGNMVVMEGNTEICSTVHVERITFLAKK